MIIQAEKNHRSWLRRLSFGFIVAYRNDSHDLPRLCTLGETYRRFQNRLLAGRGAQYAPSTMLCYAIASR